MVDPRALKILFDTYWSSAGWKSSRSTPKEDLDYAVAAGVMFPDVRMDHNQVVKWLIKVRKKIKPELVAASFLASLTTRRLDLRSALGSYAIARHLPKHEAGSRGNCTVCDANCAKSNEGLSVLNFERFKWGGVRHLDPVYMAFDLEALAETEPVTPTVADLEILFKILDAARSVPPKGRPTILERSIAKFLPSNKNERQVLLQILGYCGILQPKDQASFFDDFVKSVDREDRPTELNYPVSCWRGCDGVNEQAVAFWFPELAL